MAPPVLFLRKRPLMMTTRSIWIGACLSSLAVVAMAAPIDLTLPSPEVSGVRPMTSSEAVLLERGRDADLVFAGVQNEKISIFWSRRQGDAWGDVTKVSGETKEVEHNPMALIDHSGRLQVVWQSRQGRAGYRVCYRSQSPDGSWGEIHSFSEGRRRMLPGIVEDGEGRLYVYYDNSDADAARLGRIFVHVSEDGGKTWRDSDPNFSPDAKHGRTGPGQMVVTPQGVALAWIDQSPGPLAVVANTSSDGGRTWLESPTVVSTQRQAYRDVKLIRVHDRLHALWALGGRDEKGPFQEIYTSFSKDQGKTWSPPERIYRTRAWTLHYEPISSSEEAGFVAIEKRHLRPDRLVFRPFWENNERTEFDVAELWLAKRGGDLRGLSAISSGNMMGVMYAEEGGGSAGSAHAQVRGRQKSWSHIELSSGVQKLNGESGDVNAMGPSGFVEAEGEGETLNFVFHLARRRRFIEETLPINTQLVFGRVALH